MTFEDDNRVTFVLCIEGNAIRDQALLLCESIRKFTGRFCSSPILAFAPRPGLGVCKETLSRLRQLDVLYIDEPLNLHCPEYGSANRVCAAAWAEQHATSDWLIVLDSDTFFLREPELPQHADVAVRPVDTKGSTTSGPDDHMEGYWKQMADIAGMHLESLPYIQTTDGKFRVRASYNGGLIVARRERGLMGDWARLFFESVEKGLKPLQGRNKNVFASTGHVGIAASEYWGSNQAALALAIWRNTSRVHHYSDEYNVPLHILIRQPDLADCLKLESIAHVHYHWMFSEEWFQKALECLRGIGCESGHLDWLSKRLPLI